MNTEFFQIDEFCCEITKQQLTHHCTQASHGWNCPDKVLTLWKSGEFALVAGNADYSAKFCPWCGKDLKEFNKTN